MIPDPDSPRAKVLVVLVVALIFAAMVGVWIASQP
jgi:uncharacterized protein YneF (UPF0154 family)